MRRRSRLALAAALLLPAAAPAQDAMTVIAPDDSVVVCSDFVQKERVADPSSPSGAAIRFDRLLDSPKKGYRWDTPGTRLRFRTDAATVEVLLRYSERHTSPTARNAVGRWYVDGRTEDAWTFRTKSAAVVRAEPEAVTASIPSPGAGFHDYQVVLPYADSPEFQGLRVPAGANFEAPAAPSAVRYLAYGDSITQGFTASETTRSYAFLVADRKGWQLVNMAIAGRCSTPADGAILAAQKADVATVLIGVNDWQGGVPPETYRAHMEVFLAGLRAGQPTVPVYAITPLWVSPTWKPDKAIADLEAYRQALRDAVAAKADPNLHLIEGPSLIDPDATLFDKVAVHPNDRGFVQMADRLGALLPSP